MEVKMHNKVTNTNWLSHFLKSKKRNFIKVLLLKKSTLACKTETQAYRAEPEGPLIIKLKTTYHIETYKNYRNNSNNYTFNKCIDKQKCVEKKRYYLS